ncbi:MAG: hypothetical protein A2V93_06875 [Ignavibacteria bacterium RBG_16_34_14]|nr:MAG: hypothetical protein A2V93_06875 [Ignavibacteria bacterium RBG_16_34_14]
MKILYTCLSKSWGGLEMTAMQSAEKLQDKNILVDLLCFPGSPINVEAEKRGINCVTLKAAGYFHPLKIKELNLIIKKNSYSLIHSHYSKDLWIVVPSLNYLRIEIPLLLTKHMESSIIKKDFLHRFLYKRVNYILAISNVIKQNIINTCPVPKEKVILHYNGVDLKKFDPLKANGKKTRNEFNIKDNEVVIGMLSRITYGKGYEELLKAAKKLNEEFPNLKFLLIGEASSNEKDYKESIKKLVRDLSLEEKIIFAGFRENVSDLLSSMDIFAFPSHAESFGNSLIEAMAMEKPSVATNSHGVLDIIVDGVTGYLFIKKDEKDLAKKLKLLINSPEKRIEIGKAAKEYVIKNFDVEKQTQELIGLYRKLAP